MWMLPLYLHVNQRSDDDDDDDDDGDNWHEMLNLVFFSVFTFQTKIGLPFHMNGLTFSEILKSIKKIIKMSFTNVLHDLLRVNIRG